MWPAEGARRASCMSRPRPRRGDSRAPEGCECFDLGPGEVRRPIMAIGSGQAGDQDGPSRERTQERHLWRIEHASVRRYCAPTAIPRRPALRLRLWFTHLGGPAELAASVGIGAGAVFILEGAHEGSAATAIRHEPSFHVRRLLQRCAAVARPLFEQTLDYCGTHIAPPILWRALWNRTLFRRGRERGLHQCSSWYRFLPANQGVWRARGI